MHTSRNICLGLLVSLAFVLVQPASAQQQPQKPNLPVIMGDDICYWNISAYNRGQMTEQLFGRAGDGEAAQPAIKQLASTCCARGAQG